MDSNHPHDLLASPGTIDETGLSAGLLADLTLKSLYIRGLMRGHEIADALKLPFLNVIDKVLGAMRRERLIEVTGSAGVSEAQYGYVLSREGRGRARESLERNRYVGPAPVSLEAYVQVVQSQSLNLQSITPRALRQALAHLVLSEPILEELGPAILSGRAIFLSGNTGDGKTSIGLAIGTMFTGEIWVPYAIHVDGQIVKVYDALHHHAVSNGGTGGSTAQKGLLRHLARDDGSPVEPNGSDPVIDGGDERWVRIRRPLIVSGGELTNRNLDLILDPTTKYYEAPQQLKANGGVFLVDDLGRQQANARQILNRWIGPLDKAEDHLTLAGGNRFCVPFDVLMIFATNLKPEDVAEEVFLRRLRHRILIPDPTWQEFAEIFRREAAARKIEFSKESFDYMVEEYYDKPERYPRGVHPRDILDELLDIARYRGLAPTLSRELVDHACQAYFANLRPI